MNDDTRGGAAAEDKLEERLGNRFAAELSRAEHDYPGLRVGSEARPARWTRRRWPRLVAAPVGLLAVVMAIILAWPVLLPASPSVEAPAQTGVFNNGTVNAGVVIGPDGIPTQIDGGEHVYRPTDQASFPKSGSFLLGGYVVSFPVTCPVTVPPEPAAEAALVGCMGEFELSPEKSVPGEQWRVAPGGSAALAPFVDQAVVVRAHVHDPAATSCSAELRARCEAAVVVEAVVWPALPTQIAGERVYRAGDQRSLPQTGSFLLGGVVTTPDVVPPCAMRLNVTAAEEDLIPYCTWAAIDGVHVAPKSVDLTDLRNRYVVARVHLNDGEAALCPVAIQADCKAAIVVEQVVWTGASVAAASTPSSEPTGAVNPASPPPAPPSGPAATSEPTTGTGRLGADGVPTDVNGQTVYRAGNMSNAPMFLLGGKLTRDTSCAAPATPAAKPPACGYWMLDGVKVGTSIDMPAALDGQIVVAQVERGRTLAVCPGGSCTTDTIVIIEIVYQAPAAR
jgi:hypothetical protein